MPIIIWYLKNGFRIFYSDLVLLFFILFIVDDTTMNMKGCYKDQNWEMDILASNGEEIAEKQILFVIRATGSSSSIINKKDFKPKIFS